MTRNYLFKNRDFDNLSEEIKQVVFSKINYLTKQDFETKTIDEISVSIYDTNSIKTLVLKEDDLSQKAPVDIQIERQSEYTNYSNDKIQGTRFQFVLPFEGDARLLKVRPSVFSMQFPFGDIENNTISFKYEVEANSDKSIVFSEYKINLQILKGWVENVNNDAIQFNKNLKEYIFTKTTGRKQKIYDDLDTANSFGIPIK